MCLIAAVALTSATYAWLIVISNTEVKNIDLYVSAPDSLMFSAYTGTDASNTPDYNIVSDWKVSLQMSDISDVNSTSKWGKQTNAFPPGMVDVSSLFNATSHSFFAASHTNQGVITGFTNTPFAGNQFAKFTLWAKSTRSGFVYLDSESLLTALSATAPGNAIADTLRIGIVPVNYNENGNDGGLVSGEDWNQAVIWEPNSTHHLDTIYDGPGGNTKIVTNAVFGTDSSNVSPQTTFDFIPNGTNVKSTGYYDGSLSGIVKTVQRMDTKIALFNMNSDTIQQFNVYIWVEGADADTVNVVEKNSFSTYLKFGQEYNIFMGNTFKAVE